MAQAIGSRQQATGSERRIVELPQVRCGFCHARLFDGRLIGTIKCQRCKRLNEFFDKGNHSA